MEKGINNNENQNKDKKNKKYLKNIIYQKDQNGSLKDLKIKLGNKVLLFNNNKDISNNNNFISKNHTSSSKLKKNCEEFENILKLNKSRLKFDDKWNNSTRLNKIFKLKKIQNNFEEKEEAKEEEEEEEITETIKRKKYKENEKEMGIGINKLENEFNKEKESKIKGLLKEKEKKLNKEKELNNRNEINTKKLILLEKRDEKKSLKMENIQKEYNENKSLNQKLINNEGLNKLSKTIITMEEKNEIEQKDNVIIQGSKINKSMDIGKSRYIEDKLYLKKRNDYNDLLNSGDNIINKMMDNINGTPHILNKEKTDIKEAYQRKTYNIFNFQDKINLFNSNENNQKIKNRKRSSFNSNKISLGNNDFDERFSLRNKQKKDEKVSLKENFNINSKTLNSNENNNQKKKAESEDIKEIKKDKNEENNSNLELIESDKNNKKLDKEEKEKEENKIELNNEIENVNKELSEDIDENSFLEEEFKNIKEDLKPNKEEIEELKKEKVDLMLMNKKLMEENVKMNQKLKDNKDLILKNEKLNIEKENLKEKIEKLKKYINNFKEKFKEEKMKLNNIIENLNDKNIELKKEKEEINEKLNEEKEKIEKINKEKEEINNELNKEKESNKEISDLKLENNKLNKKIKEEIQKYNNLNNKNIELNNKNLELNKENKNIKLELNKGIDDKKNLIEENQKHKIFILQYDKEKKNLISKNNELEKQLNELKLLFEQNQIQQNEILTNIMNNNPMILYSKPTSIGLNNIGATCFMNSTLQCLSQTKELTIYFLKPKNKSEIINNNLALKNMNNNQLCPVYLELIQKLWERNGPKSFSPNKFMNTVNEINPLFKTGQAGDAKDFIIFVLEQLHKELKRPINSNNNLNSETLNQYDKNNSWNHFFKDFKNELSIISDIFYGINETTNDCLNCKNTYNFRGLSNNPICYNYGIFNCLIFPLEEVKNFKYNNNYQFNNFQINNCVSIYDCFYYNQKTELFTGQNKNYCNICKQLYDSYYTSKIYTCPTVLILILNRGKGNMFNIKLFFDEIIDITEFVLQKENSKIIYNLYGVITHIGQSGPNAHFVASCKSPIDNKWYRYNDSFVNPIENVQKEIIDFGTPYILFYHKQNP